MEPLAMPSMHPIVCQQEAQPPHEQDAIVDDGTPQQCLTYHPEAHEPSPMCLPPLCSGLLVRLCYTHFWQHKRHIDLRHLSWSGNSTDVLFVLLSKDCSEMSRKPFLSPLQVNHYECYLTESA